MIELDQILVGTLANDKTGDPLRNAFQKVNANMITIAQHIDALEANSGNISNYPPEVQVVIQNETDVLGANLHGGLHVYGGVEVGKSLYVHDTVCIGVGSQQSEFTVPVLIARKDGAQFIQLGILNTSGLGSADLVTYADSGSDLQGWADMGFTGSAFNDANYTITKEGDGYLFVLGLDDDVSHGNLVLATGHYGKFKDIVFATGGFAAENEVMRYVHADNVLNIQHDLRVKGIIYGQPTQGYDWGVINLVPGQDYPGQSVSIYPTIAGVDENHIHIASNQADIFLGDDNIYASAKQDGSFKIASFKDVQSSINSISWVDRGGRLNINYGWDSNGIWFTGDANNNFNGGNYPVFFDTVWQQTDKLDISFDFVFNQNCADVSIAFWLDNVAPQFDWGANPSRIACQYDCTGVALILTTTQEIDNAISLSSGNTYRAQVIYDPNNTPNLTFNTYDSQDNLVNSMTANDVLPGSFRFGFTADQDNAPIRTYINNLVVIVNDNPYYSNNLTTAFSGQQNIFNYDQDGNLIMPPNGDVKDSQGRSLTKTIVQNLQDQYNDYTLTLSDAGKHVYKNEGDGYSVIVPTNNDVPFEIGTAITIVSGDSYTYIYPIDGNTTQVWGAGFNQYGNWYIPHNSIATLLKIGVDKWMLSGVGLAVD